MSDIKSKTADTKSAIPKKPAAEVGFCVYIGPTILGVIQNGMIFRGTKKEVLASLQKATEKNPLIATLIVPDDTLPVDRIKVKTPGNLLYVYYQKILSGNK